MQKQKLLGFMLVFGLCAGPIDVAAQGRQAPTEDSSSRSGAERNARGTPRQRKTRQRRTSRKRSNPRRVRPRRKATPRQVNRRRPARKKETKASLATLRHIADALRHSRDLTPLLSEKTRKALSGRRWARAVKPALGEAVLSFAKKEPKLLHGDILPTLLGGMVAAYSDPVTYAGLGIAMAVNCTEGEECLELARWAIEGSKWISDECDTLGFKTTAQCMRGVKSPLRFASQAAYAAYIEHISSLGLAREALRSGKGDPMGGMTRNCGLSLLPTSAPASESGKLNTLCSDLAPDGDEGVVDPSPISQTSHGAGSSAPIPAMALHKMHVIPSMNPASPCYGLDMSKLAQGGVSLDLKDGVAKFVDVMDIAENAKYLSDNGHPTLAAVYTATRAILTAGSILPPVAMVNGIVTIGQEAIDGVLHAVEPSAKGKMALSGLKLEAWYWANKERMQQGKPPKGLTQAVSEKLYDKLKSKAEEVKEAAIAANEGYDPEAASGLCRDLLTEGSGPCSSAAWSHLKKTSESSTPSTPAMAKAPAEDCGLEYICQQNAVKQLHTYQYLCGLWDPIPYSKQSQTAQGKGPGGGSAGPSGTKPPAPLTAGQPPCCTNPQIMCTEEESLKCGGRSSNRVKRGVHARQARPKEARPRPSKPGGRAGSATPGCCKTNTCPPDVSCGPPE